jgi:hypothetical protein
MESFTKQSYEEFVIAGDFVNVLEAGETLVLADCDIKAYDSSDTDVTSSILENKAVSGSQLQITVKDGSNSSSPYIISFYAETSDGNKWELDVKMKLKETGPIKP